MPSTNHTATPAPAGLPANVIALAEELAKPHRETLNRVLAHVAQAHGVTTAELLQRGQGRRVMAAKREAVNLAVRALCPPLTREVVADWLNMGRASLYRFLDLDQQDHYDAVAARLGFKPLTEETRNG